VVAVLSGRCAVWTAPGAGLVQCVSPGFSQCARVGRKGSSQRAGFARRVVGKDWVLCDRPAESPAPGRCPSWPWPPGPGQSRAFARLVSDPRRRRSVRTAAGAGDAATGCARRRLRHAKAAGRHEVRCAGQPCGSTGSALGRFQHGPRVVAVLSGRCAAWTAPGAGLVRCVSPRFSQCARAGRKGSSQRPAADGWQVPRPARPPPPKGAPAIRLRLIARRCCCGAGGGQ